MYSALDFVAIAWVVSGFVRWDLLDDPSYMILKPEKLISWDLCPRKERAAKELLISFIIWSKQ